MNTNELGTLLIDLHEQMDEVSEKIDKYVTAGNHEAREILEDVWYSIESRVDDVERRIAHKKARKIKTQTDRLISDNID